MTPAFVESRMTFGPYAEGHCFRIEQSKAYQAIQNDVKVAEFLLLRREAPTRTQTQVFWVVEAKSSAPRPQSQSNFDTFIGEIKEKWINTYSLSLALRLQRHRASFNELPAPFQAMDLRLAQFQFVLVIHNHDELWIPPLQEALQQAMRPTIRTWAIKAPAVAVINDAEARRRNLIA